MSNKDEREQIRLLEQIRKSLESVALGENFIARELIEQRKILKEIARNTLPPKHVFPTSITFKEITMALAPVAGNTLVYTGTLSPAGAVFPSDTTFAVTSSDPTVTPTVDATGLIVTIPLPATFVDNPASPFSVTYTATSVSGPVSLTATITPSIPAVLPTGITFVQTN
jgi:hypothetical protein